MARFKVGQRVRTTGTGSSFTEDQTRIVGREGVIVRAGRSWDWIVHLPGVPHARIRGKLPDEQYGFDSCDLAPLTDPKADAFVESIKRLKPYEEPKVEREKAVLSGRTNT